MIASRRRFLFGAAASLIAAPALVRAASLDAMKATAVSDGVQLLASSHPHVPQLVIRGLDHWGHEMMEVIPMPKLMAEAKPLLGWNLVPGGGFVTTHKEFRQITAIEEYNPTLKLHSTWK